MSFQQLDLFCNPIPGLSPKKEVETVVTKPAAIETTPIVVEVAMAPKVEDKIALIEEKKIPKPKSNRGRKPKPKLEQTTEIVKAKRGRKSYTEAYGNVDLVDIPSDEQVFYRLDMIAETVNIVLGHCTKNLAVTGQPIGLTPPIVLEDAGSLRRPKGAIFSSISHNTSYGVLDVVFITPPELYGDNLSLNK